MQRLKWGCSAGEIQIFEQSYKYKLDEEAKESLWSPPSKMTMAKLFGEEMILLHQLSLYIRKEHLTMDLLIWAIKTERRIGDSREEDTDASSGWRFLCYSDWDIQCAEESKD